MRVRMRRRYRDGVVLSKEEFYAQQWVKGMLFLQTVEGRPQLGLWQSGVPGTKRPRSASSGGPSSPPATTTRSALLALRRLRNVGATRSGTAQ